MELLSPSKCSFTFLLLLITVARCTTVVPGDRMQGFDDALPKVELNFNVTKVNIAIGSSKAVALSLLHSLPENVSVSVDLLTNANGFVELSPGSVQFSDNSTGPFTVIVKAKKAASNVICFTNCSSAECSNYVKGNHFSVNIVHSIPLVVIIQVVGWIYFVAWSISFYPQIYLNWKRGSVIGLDFNFLSLNLTGFICYSIFNCVFYWSPVVQQQYYDNDQYGSIPVDPNDVVFALHAVFATAVTILQCFLYERGHQTVSKVCRLILCLMWLFIVICLIVAIARTMKWLLFIQMLSYVKLTVTLIKYVPQALYNYRRKSTVGWSIGNVLLDFTGGSFSVLQMFLQAYNSDDWNQIFGDFTKFGLGLFSLLFDVLFIVQHYVLYRDHVPYAPIDD